MGVIYGRQWHVPIMGVECGCNDGVHERGSSDFVLEVGGVHAADLVLPVIADADAVVVHQAGEAVAVDQDDALADAADILAGIVGEARLAPGDQRAVEAGRRR